MSLGPGTNNTNITLPQSLSTIRLLTQYFYYSNKSMYFVRVYYYFFYYSELYQLTSVVIVISSHIKFVSKHFKIYPVKFLQF